MTIRDLALAAAMTATALVGTPLNATTFDDPVGDFLGTFTGPQNGDLDILFGSATFKSDYLLLSSTMDGASSSSGVRFDGCSSFMGGGWSPSRSDARPMLQGHRCRRCPRAR